MKNTFRERGKGYEAKFKLDEEQKFRAESRRNKLLGLWAAEQMGIAGAEAEAYAKEVVIADLEEPGVDDVIRKVMKDFSDRDIEMDEQRVRDELERQEAIAYEQIAGESS